MISRLSTAAALFAVLATTTLAFAVEAPAKRPAAARTVVDATAAPIVVMPRVEVIGRRSR